MILNRLLAYFGKNDDSIDKLITEKTHKMHMWNIDMFVYFNRLDNLMV